MLRGQQKRRRRLQRFGAEVMSDVGEDFGRDGVEHLDQRGGDVGVGIGDRLRMGDKWYAKTRYGVQMQKKRDQIDQKTGMTEMSARKWRSCSKVSVYS